ncbi:MAG: amino acid permease [Spirochaetales bacterium]|nr:amino acid permease [Spirochaetales bacterium]
MKVKKEITFFGVFSIATGAMISSGIFILPSLAFSKIGTFISLSYLIAGILGLVGILSVIELSTAMPKSGGDYFFINKTFGPLVGTISGFISWFAISLKSAFAIFGISEIIFLYTGFPIYITGFFLTLFFVIVNIIGVKEAVVFQIILVSGLLLLLLTYVLFGVVNINVDYYNFDLTFNFNEILKTSGFIFISFGGLLNVANISEEISNPKKNIPRGILASIITVTILYTLITFVITGTLEGNSFRNSLTPVADSSMGFMGNIGYAIIMIASLLAFITTGNAGIMAASRYPLALGQDQLLPHGISHLNRKFKTPIVAISLTGLIIYISLLIPLELLVKSASTVILTSYILTNIAVIILRESNLTNYRPSFKTPLYPFVQLFSIVVFTFFIIDLGAASVEISLSLVLISFCVYIFYGKRSKKREYALLHLLQKITDSKLVSNLLEDELRDILIDRDEISQDNFDQLIKNSMIKNINYTGTFENLINKENSLFSEEVNMDKEDIIDKLLTRQKESDCAITDFVAIPHIVINGSNKMFLTIIRSMDGIEFSENKKNIKAIFLIGGTADIRSLHIKTLASIATLVKQKDFEKNWLLADNEIELKNMLLLNLRERFI